MDYLEVISIIEKNKLNLVKMLEGKNLSKEQMDSIQHSIDNYNYIIELTEMNHFERGNIH
ncbi:DUF3896 domain-containing protein [Bacillus salipaludis]|uniref:DUF3896 domain-containing protein n=1 Tax=Bacillus salipaludis TaxID=2547811 RepID=A0A4R5VQ77_9BACI|nr:DUF3896 family protein [Bacillus salipaludis]MDQ6598719.1 DUF3896 family protein [Bacillus salipaludis]TDK60738.1 DUF3896 domain-containing protein [Bacillus salipaludis]